MYQFYSQNNSDVGYPYPEWQSAVCDTTQRKWVESGNSDDMKDTVGEIK